MDGVGAHPFWDPTSEHVLPLKLRSPPLAYGEFIYCPRSARRLKDGRGVFCGEQLCVLRAAELERSFSRKGWGSDCLVPPAVGGRRQAEPIHGGRNHGPKQHRSQNQPDVSRARALTGTVLHKVSWFFFKNSGLQGHFQLGDSPVLPTGDDRS